MMIQTNMRWELRKCRVLIVTAALVFAAIESSLAENCQQIRDDPSAVFLRPDDKRPLPLVAVLENVHPTYKQSMKTKVFAENDCSTRNGTYHCCAIFQVTGLDVRETVCVDFAHRNQSFREELGEMLDAVETFDTTLSVGNSHQTMGQLNYNLKGSGDVLQNVTIPLCIPPVVVPLVSICLNVKNTTYNTTEKTIRSCFSLDFGIVGFSTPLFSLNLNCLKYQNKSIVKDPSGGSRYGGAADSRIHLPLSPSQNNAPPVSIPAVEPTNPPQERNNFPTNNPLDALNSGESLRTAAHQETGKTRSDHSVTVPVKGPLDLSASIPYVPTVEQQKTLKASTNPDFSTPAQIKGLSDLVPSVPEIFRNLPDLSASVPKSISDLSASISRNLPGLPVSVPRNIPDFSVSIPKSFPDLPASIPKSISDVSASIPKSLPDLPASIPKSLSDASASIPKSLSDVSASIPKSLPDLPASIPKSLPDISASIPKSFPDLSAAIPRSLSDILSSRSHAPVAAQQKTVKALADVSVLVQQKGVPDNSTSVPLKGSSDPSVRVQPEISASVPYVPTAEEQKVLKALSDSAAADLVKSSPDLSDSRPYVPHALQQKVLKPLSDVSTSGPVKGFSDITASIPTKSNQDSPASFPPVPATMQQKTVRALSEISASAANVPTIPQQARNLPAEGPRRLFKRLVKRNIPGSAEMRDHLPEGHLIRDKTQRVRHFINLYNFDRNWQHQFFIKR